jgi:hypothetical protein
MTYILVLEELGDTKEEVGSLMRSECLADVEEVDDSCEQRTAFSRRDGALVEHARLLENGRLVVQERLARRRRQCQRGHDGQSGRNERRQVKEHNDNN